MKPSDSKSIIDDIIKDSKLSLNNNNNKDKLFSLAYGCRDDIATIRKFDLNGLSMLVSQNWFYVFSHEC